MKLFSKLWWIFAIVGTIAAFLIPYNRSFGFFNVIEIFILFFISTNIISKEKELKEHNENKISKISIRLLSLLAYIFPIIFVLSKLFIGADIIISYTGKSVSTPFQVGSNEYKISVVCLIIEMICNVLLLISFIYKGKVFKRITNEYVVYINKENYKKLNILCIITIIISIIIGFFNPYENYMTIIYNFWYPFTMFIYFINIKISRKFSRSTIFSDRFKDYDNDHGKSLESKGWKIYMIGSLCFLKIMFTVVQFQLHSSKIKSQIKFLQNTFLLNNASLMFILATVAEIAVVITFGIRIWKEDGQADEIILRR
ncbi:hypothetical protein NRP93_000416 [Clostridium botulinum]|nr:hypothetical protein [Clostridium botulinum]